MENKKTNTKESGGENETKMDDKKKEERREVILRKQYYGTLQQNNCITIKLTNKRQVHSDKLLLFLNIFYTCTYRWTIQQCGDTLDQQQQT